MKRIFLFLLAFVSAALTAKAQGYEIEVKIKHIHAGDTLILGHHFSEYSRLIPDDTVFVDKNGYGVFKGKEPLPTGMYFIFLPKKTYFDILIDKDAGEKFYIENDTADFLNNVVVRNSLENQVFMDYQKFLGDKRKQFTDLREKYEKIKGNPDKEKAIFDEQAALNKEVDDKYHSLAAQYPDMFFVKFLKANREVEIPAEITGQNERYFWYKAHYFDNFDFTYAPLLRTPIYQDKIENYLTQMVFQEPDSLIKETVWLVNKTRPKGKLNEKNGELFRYMLVYLFNKYAKLIEENMIAENVYCALADIYVKDAFWESDTSSFITKLKDKVVRRKNCLVGHIAQDLVMKLIPDTKEGMEALRPAIEELKEKGTAIEKAKPGDFETRRNDVVKLLDEFITKFGKNYYSVLKNWSPKYKLIVFWEPDCSHCREEMPKLMQFYKDTLSTKNCEIFAVYMGKSPDNLADVSRHVGKCFDFLQEKGLYNVPGWHNVYNPFDQFRTNYDINSTPTIYMLDKNNEIIAKRIGYQQAYNVITAWDEMEKAKQNKK